MSATPCGLSLVVLRNIPLFSGLDENELEKLSRVAGRKRAERGASIVRAGDSTDSLYVLISGIDRLVPGRVKPRDACSPGPGDGCREPSRRNSIQNAHHPSVVWS